MAHWIPAFAGMTAYLASVNVIKKDRAAKKSIENNRLGDDVLVLSRKQGLTPSRLFRPLLAVFAVFYLLFHALHGERGIYAYFRDKRQLAELQQALEKTRDEREKVELRVKHMRDGSIDADLLDEQMRRMMGVMKPGEVVLLEPDGK